MCLQNNIRFHIESFVLYITIISPLYHHYITIISPLYHHYITIISLLYHHYITIISPLYLCIVLFSTKCNILTNNIMMIQFTFRCGCKLKSRSSSYEFISHCFVGVRKNSQRSKLRG